MADKIVHVSISNKIIVTKRTQALINHGINLAELELCSHEETDSRIFFHARYAAGQGSLSIIVKTSDKDILIIGLGIFETLQSMALQQMWLKFGQGKHL